MNFTKPTRATQGPKATQNLVNNHADCIEELQGAGGGGGAAGVNGADAKQYGELTRVLAARAPGDLVIYEIRAVLVEVLE